MQLQLAVQEWKTEHEAGTGAGAGAQGHAVPHVAAAVAGGWLCAHPLWGHSCPIPQVTVLLLMMPSIAQVPGNCLEMRGTSSAQSGDVKI